MEVEAILELEYLISLFSIVNRDNVNYRVIFRFVLSSFGKFNYARSHAKFPVINGDTEATIGTRVK